MTASLIFVDDAGDAFVVARGGELVGAAAALSRFFVWARDQGLRPPASFVEGARRMEAVSPDNAHRRQGATSLPTGSDVVDAASVLVGREEVGRLLGVSPRTVDRLLAAGELPKVKVGRRSLCRRADVESYAEGQ